MVPDARRDRSDRRSAESALEEYEAGTPRNVLVLRDCRTPGAVYDGEEPRAFVLVGFLLRDCADFGDRVELPAEPVELFTH